MPLNPETLLDFQLSTYLRQHQDLIEQALDQAIPELYPETLYKAMRYSLLGGGKRLRPILCLASCELVGGTVAMALPTACALEMIHTMSLIHDDLPAMDNDDYRRGKLTTHKVFGDDIAILAGDALWALAFEWIASQTSDVPAERVVRVIAHVGHAIAATGLVGGQVADLEAEGKSDLSLEQLNFIHTHKTGALLETAVVSGAMLGGAAEADLTRLSNYAKKIGLAFQIVDDILDITATQEVLGKTVGKDLKVQKATYPSFWGLEESQKQANQLVDEAKAELLPWGSGAMPLLAIADYITARKH
ncbi:MAG TPA: farnesyl diphosphate synthase [Coleofasciculaceae cyanobacterium]